MTQQALSTQYVISQSDRVILRRLALRVAELAARPIEQIKRELWRKHNQLQGDRPLVFVSPENGWGELITDRDLECGGDLAREWEYRLRQEIWWGEELCDDRVIVPYFDIGYVFTKSDWGLVVERIGGADGGAYTWHSPLKSYDQMDQLRFPEFTVDYAATDRLTELAEDTLGDLLTVRRKTSFFWTLGLTWTLVDLRGMEQMMFDMLDDPDNLHRLMAFLRDGHMAMLDFLEDNDLFSLNNEDAYIGSGGFGWTDELPGADFDGTHVRCCDLWGFAESQETVGVSPAMFEEFILPYQLPLLERFGLNCYGCCEPLDKRWHIVQQVPRLRRVSASPWANRAFMAEMLGRDYIFSMKPHPAKLATDTLDEDAVRAELRADLAATRDCHVEVIMKDTHTFHRDPRRPGRWVQIAREEIGRM